MSKKRKRKIKVGRILEFFCIGLIMGIVEDMIALRAVSNTMITWHVIGVIALVALPFAVISELIVDYFKPFHRKKPKK